MFNNDMWFFLKLKYYVNFNICFWINYIINFDFCILIGILLMDILIINLNFFV